MIILTNCLRKADDEGSLKVAKSLITAIRRAVQDTTVVSCAEASPLCQEHLPANKLMLSPRLARFLWRRKEITLYIPAFARMLPTAYRICLLSLYTRRKLKVLLPMRSPAGRLARLLLRISGAEIIALSEESWRMYREIIGERAKRIKAGVDVGRFVPVSAEEKKALRYKYGIPGEKPVVLHVGHLKEGRNVGQLLAVDQRFHAVLVTSTQTRQEQDEALRQKLLASPQVTLIDTYLPKIEEIYQLADVYLFPVTAELSCIDVPLSALEAAACGVPVVATAYGELQQLMDKDGFYRIESFAPERLNEALNRAVQEGKNPRESVLEYDWDCGAMQLMEAEDRRIGQGNTAKP